MKNYIAVDYKSETESEFSRSLTQYSGFYWEMYSKVSNKRKGIWQNLYRYAMYFYVPFLMFIKRKQIKNLVAWQQFYGIIFAFYCRLFCVKKRTSLVILTFMYSPKKGLLGKLYERFMKYSIENEYVDLIVCFSQEEIKWYHRIFCIRENKIRFLPIAIENLNWYDTNIDRSKYVFSAGYSGRDYEFLIKSLNDTEFNVLIADNRIKTPYANNVKVKKVSNGEDVLRLMSSAYVVVIPLKDKLKSAGHLIALRAMQMGKPVICTDSYGMHPYIQNNENGFLINNTKEDLCIALRKLYTDEALYKRMSLSALSSATKYSFDKLALRLCTINKEISLFNS